MNSPDGQDNSATVLIVDDDDDIRTLLGEYLRLHGFDTLEAAQGLQMQAILAEAQVDLVVLDLNLPGEDGLSLCRRIRAESTLPVIMLTAKTAPLDRVLGLETGADDYVCKPFEPLELLSRIRSVLRRTRLQNDSQPHSTTPVKLRFAEWELDLVARHLCSPEGTVVSLSGSEFRLLKIFLDRPNRVLNRDQLMDMIHGRDAGPFDRAIDLQISRIRQKIEVDSKNPQIIKTVRNEGYVLSAPVEVVAE